MESSNRPDSCALTAHFASPDIGNRIDLARHVMACLREAAPEIHAAVHVTVIGGTVVVRGKLPTEFEKHACLECCRRVPGVLRLVDELVVANRSPSSCNDADEW